MNIEQIFKLIDSNPENLSIQYTNKNGTERLIINGQDVLEEDKSCHDSYHIDYLRDHINAMADAINIDGVELWGYTPWGCIDLVSASTGEMHKRYGLIYVDYQDDGTGEGDRYRKDSFYWYKKVIASNGEDLD